MWSCFLRLNTMSLWLKCFDVDLHLVWFVDNVRTFAFFVDKALNLRFEFKKNTCLFFFDDENLIKR